VLTRVKDPERFGVVELKNGKIVRLVEKPKHYISDLALAGVYFFRPTIFPVIEKLKPSWRNELEITDAIQSLLDIGGRISYHEVSGWWKDTGRPEDILEANQLVLRDLKSSVRGTIEKDAIVSGHVDVGSGTVVRKGTELRGPVVIGDHSEIGAGAKIGPNTSVGNRVRILGAQVENSILLDGTLVNCQDRIIDSIIGKDSRIVSEDPSRSGSRSFVVGENTFVRL
jgi:glucose-1-phosphate thymidylyltransferase